MFGDRLVSAFEQLKAVFDPGNRMNPGKVVQPTALDQHLRLGGRCATTPSRWPKCSRSTPRDGHPPPRRHALAQVHCHQHAVLGWDADAHLLERAAVDAASLDAGYGGKGMRHEAATRG